MGGQLTMESDMCITREDHVKSWTRTLNIDDAHALLAIAVRGLDYDEWTEQCHKALPHLSMPRRRELIRMIREYYLDLGPDKKIVDGLFTDFYTSAPAVDQIDLVQVQWAMSHPISLVANDTLVRSALASGEPQIPLAAVEKLVATQLETASAESRRKTRTTLLGALEGVGTLETRGTGQHRSIRATRGFPTPLTFGYLVQRDLHDREIDGMMRSEVLESSLPVRLTCCPIDHARHCLQDNLRKGLLVRRGDEIGLPRRS